MIDTLPADTGDDLHRDAEGIKTGRWYVEGYERFADDGSLVRYDPKGMEIRTHICDSIEATLEALGTDVAALDTALAKHGLGSAIVGFNPFRSVYPIQPPLSEWERAHRSRSPEETTEHLHMSTFGPDLNLSRSGLSPAGVVDAGRKLTYYSPWIVPFSFSSPFRDGTAWGGLSARTFMRTGRRPAVLVYLDDAQPQVQSDPSLTRTAPISAEIGRMEFKAFDAIGDLALYGELLSLLTGLVLDETLLGRRTTPDAAAHQHVATTGFGDDKVHAEIGTVLDAAERALAGRDADLARLAALRGRWARRECAAATMLAAHAAGATVAEVIAGSRS